MWEKQRNQQWSIHMLQFRPCFDLFQHHWAEHGGDKTISSQWQLTKAMKRTYSPILSWLNRTLTQVRCKTINCKKRMKSLDTIQFKLKTGTDPPDATSPLLKLFLLHFQINDSWPTSPLSSYHSFWNLSLQGPPIPTSPLSSYHSFWNLSLQGPPIPTSPLSSYHSFWNLSLQGPPIPTSPLSSYHSFWNLSLQGHPIPTSPLSSYHSVLTLSLQGHPLPTHPHPQPTPPLFLSFFLKSFPSRTPPPHQHPPSSYHLSLQGPPSHQHPPSSYHLSLQGPPPPPTPPSLPITFPFKDTPPPPTPPLPIIFPFKTPPPLSTNIHPSLPITFSEFSPSWTPPPPQKGKMDNINFIVRLLHPCSLCLTKTAVLKVLYLWFHVVFHWWLNFPAMLSKCLFPTANCSAPKFRSAPCWAASRSPITSIQRNRKHQLR